VLVWRMDPFRVPRPVSLVGAVACGVVITGLSLAVPEEPWEQFQGVNHLSTFVRSGVTTGYELATKGWIDIDTTTSDQLRTAAAEPCHMSGKPPNIIMVLDEASFDASVLPDIKLPAGYGGHFRSFDGKTRSLLVEGSGGPTWYTEYNVLTGLSVRSYGRFSESVTRLAAGHVKRGLPHALRKCGYSTYSLYSWFGAFVGARRFQTATGVEHFLDAKELRTGPADTDIFFYDHAVRVIAQDRDRGPVFVFVYLAVNHFPWDYRYRPDLLPDWVNPGNPFEIDEYLRRQELSARDYAQFKERLAREFPDEQVLVVRFGDHQPLFAKRFLDPAVDQAEVAARILRRDARYFTTYYAIDGVHFRPVDLSSALDTLDAPYLPLVVLQAAGVPLDPTFVEQKKILGRCRGLFYLCADGAEARRFNRLLIDAGLIQGF